MMLLCPEGVSLHFARAGGYDVDQVPDAEQMRKFALSTLDQVVDSISLARPDLILYGCTSATLAHGPKFDQEFTNNIEKRAGVPAISAAGALVASLKEIGARKIGFSSPYVDSLNQIAIMFLEDSGIETVSNAYVGSDLGNYGQGELTPDQVFELGQQADSPKADAVVLSCTDMRAVEASRHLEQAIGKPVISSNGAMMAEAVRRLGI